MTSLLLSIQESFTNTDVYDCKISLTLDGRQIADTKVDIGVEPLSQQTYQLPRWRYLTPWSKEEPWMATDAGEYVVTVSFVLKGRYTLGTAWSGGSFRTGYLRDRSTPAEKSPVPYEGYRWYLQT